MNDSRTHWLATKTVQIIAGATIRDTDRVVRAIEDVDDRYGPDGLYGVCYGLAESVRCMVWPEVDQLPDAAGSRGALWAARFLAAYVNGDADTASALFYGQLGDHELILDGLAALVEVVGEAGRQAMDGGL